MSGLGNDAPRAEAVDRPQLEIIAGYKVHPLASRFELIVGEDFEKLVEAAARAGRLYPAETHNGFLIDGRNRLRVQEELRRRGIEIEVCVVEWEPHGDETVEEHIWSVNANRRHLTADQRAALALEFLPQIRAARQARQEASRFGKNGIDPAAAESPSPDGRDAHTHRTSAEKDAASSVGCLASLANVSHYKARQAIALHNAVEAGAVSESEIDAVVAGDQPLSAAVPRRRRAPRETACSDWPAEVDGFDEEDVIVDAAPVPSEDEARRRWRRVSRDFLASDLPAWRQLFIEVLTDEQQRHTR